eukprot:649927_1
MGCCLSRKEDSPTNADLSDVNEFLIDTSLKNETFESLFSKKGWWRLGKPLTILLCCFLVLHLTIRAVSNSLLFQGTTGFLFGPNKRTADDCDCKATYQSSGLTNVRETLFPSGSFTKLHGVFVPAQKAVATESVPTIIYFHGNLATVETSSYTVWNIQNYLKGKVNVFVWDYRRYGLSGGIFPTERTMLQDSKAAYDYVVKQTEVDREKVFAFGESVGGAVAIQFVEKYWNLLAGAIFQNTFTEFSEKVSRTMPPELKSTEWKSIDRIGNIECPILMFSSQLDTTVPPAMMLELRKAAKEAKIVQIPKSGHRNAPSCGHKSGCPGSRCTQRYNCYWVQLREFINNPSAE